MSKTNMKCCSLVSSEDLMHKKNNAKELSKESMTVTMTNVLNFQSRCDVKTFNILQFIFRKGKYKYPCKEILTE